MNRVLVLLSLSCMMAGDPQGIVAQELDEAVLKAAEAETLLSLPEPPFGYALAKHPIVVAGQLAVIQVQLTKEDAVSKVLIGIEPRDMSELAKRKAAAKAYVNAFGDGLTGAGLKSVTHSVPDMEKLDFKTPVDMEFVFSNDAGEKIHCFKRIFFIKKGYDISVIATNENELKKLTEWAKKVRPAQALPRQN
jgi:hypothetical protein